MSGVWDTLTGKSGKKAAQASERAAGVAAVGQTEALDYLKEREALPRQFQEGALTNLAGIYGLEGGEGSQQDLIDQAMNSPLYQQMMGNQSLGEDAILRNAAATGGFRSGTTQANLSEYNTRLGNEALLSSYNQQLSGIQGLANLPQNANAIAQATAAPGMTQAQGITAGANAVQQGNQGLTNSLLGLGGAGIMAFSDIRLKSNIQYIGTKGQHRLYTWTWNHLAKMIGLTGASEGVMAHEVYDYAPEAISTDGGILLVDYSKLGLM